MSRVSQLIDNDTYDKARKELKKHGSISKISVKLKAIVAAKTHGISKVAEVFDITRKTLMSWIKDFKNQGSSRLLVQSGRGRKTKINNEQLKTIKKWINNNPNITIKELKLMIKEHFMLEISMMTVHRILKKLLFSYITPRPKHNKQEKGKQEEFKKKSSTNN
jgi:transposase